jgi:hypothetical protein
MGLGDYRPFFNVNGVKWTCHDKEVPYDWNGISRRKGFRGDRRRLYNDGPSGRGIPRLLRAAESFLS